MKIFHKKCVLVAALAIILAASALHMEAGAAGNGNAKKAASEVKKTAKVKKPGTVSKLKVVKVKKDSVKINFKKAKGASGYQILIFQRVSTRDYWNDTPIVYAKNTKKTAYTIKNLVPGTKYTIKVRAYKKGKNGKPVYGKMKSVKANTPGKPTKTYIVCNACWVRVPDNAYAHCEHFDAAYDLYGEVHAGYTIVFK